MEKAAIALCQTIIFRQNRLPQLNGPASIVGLDGIVYLRRVSVPMGVGVRMVRLMIFAVVMTRTMLVFMLVNMLRGVFDVLVVMRMLMSMRMSVAMSVLVVVSANTNRILSR
jgi:hypothetical protein